ncbi:MAG: cell wall-binding repeat-containing protein [Tissierellia bacterium]|nr:cell wall-binding repeat-containing protein [Tissierellia bacterium]
MRTKASISFKKRVLLLLTSCMFITLFSSTVSAEEISIQRISGGNRYETALKIAEEVNPDSTEFLLVSGENYPDALAGAPLSKGRIPILLTSKNSLDSQALTKLRNLSKPKVTILGGELTISSEVTTELQNEGILYKRISGQNRYETAALIAKEIRTNQIYVASG